MKAKTDQVNPKSLLDLKKLKKAENTILGRQEL